MLDIRGLCNISEASFFSLSFFSSTFLLVFHFALSLAGNDAKQRDATFPFGCNSRNRKAIRTVF